MDEEIAFDDALAHNQSAREVMGEPTLRVIAHVLLTSLKGHSSINWMHRDAARARMRVLLCKWFCSRRRRCRRNGWG